MAGCLDKIIERDKMELTIKEEKALKEFVRATQSEIKIDMEGYGILKPFLKDRWLKDFDKEKYRKEFFVSKALYYAEQLSNVENFLIPYSKKGFRAILYEGKISDIKVPKGIDISSKERKELIFFSNSLLNLREIIQRIEVNSLSKTKPSAEGSGKLKTHTETCICDYCCNIRLNKKREEASSKSCPHCKGEGRYVRLNSPSVKIKCKVCKGTGKPS